MMRAILRALFVSAILASSATASSPVIRGIKPAGGQRGTEVKITFTGQRLADTQAILFYQPGIEVTELKPSNDGRVDATFRIQADAALGLHDLRVRTATGISPLRTFSVGSLREITEREPNNDFGTPQPIDMDVVVNGVADNEDIDYFSVEAKKGERITAEIEGIRLGLTLFDPYVAILDQKRFELASSDDSALIWQDGFVSLVAPNDGTYIIAARESAYRGNGNCIYRLHVGHFPRPTAVLPAGGKIGESVTVRWIGDILGERTTSVVLPPTAEPNFGLLAEDEQGTAPYPNAFRLSPFDNAAEVEPNDQPVDATAFEPPVALNGVIGAAGDVDYYSFKAKKDQTFDVRVFARKIRSPLDSVLTITTRDGKNVANNDDNNGPDSYIRFKAPKDGEYTLRVRDHLGKGGPDYVYRIELSAIEPRLALTTRNEIPRRGTGPMAISVPKGNRQAILINAARVEFGGALELSASNLPAGVTFDAQSIPTGTNVVPVLFKAEPDAALGATLATISGRSADSKDGEIPSEFTSTCELVLGPNNVPFWTRAVDALAVAVTEEVPFSIEVVEPTVPIVRGGSLELKVIAKRKEGFTAPIAVSLPWNPPGISSKGSISIAAGQTEAVIPLNANNGADLKTWNIVVDGTYIEPPPGNPLTGNGNNRGRRGAGRLTVSSEYTKLTVAPPMLAVQLATVGVEQGNEVDLPVKFTKQEFAGEAEVTLIGLPNKATTEPVTITRETADAVFHIKTDPTTPVCDVKNLFCKVVVKHENGPIVHSLGKGRLRVDAPLAQKKAAPSKAATASAGALSRLEKLRLEAKERLKAASEADGKPAEAAAETSPQGGSKAADESQK